MRIFLSPAAMDVVVFLVLFAVSYRAGETGVTTRQTAWLTGLMQIVYMGGSLAAGWILNRRNARSLVLASVVALALVALFSLEVVDFRWLLVAMALLGIAAAFFFNAFQTFMRGEAPPGGLVRATAFYTASWSGGAATGFFASGLFYKWGPHVLAFVALALCAAVWILLVRHQPRPHDEASADDHVEIRPGLAPGLPAAYVGIAWIMVFTVTFIQRPIQTFFPALSGRDGVPPILAGLPLFLHMALQALLGGLMGRAGRWLYHFPFLAAVQIAAALVLLGLWLFPAYAVAAPLIAALGLWTGFTFFCGVFYASNAGPRSRNIGVNECLVGLGSFAGLFVCESFMKPGHEEVLYAVCAVSLVLSILLEAAALRWKTARCSSANGPAEPLPIPNLGRETSGAP